MRIKIMGKRWMLRFVPTLGQNWGDCNSPTMPRKQMRVVSSLRGEKRLAVLIHEMLHAAEWNLDEAFIQEASTDIAHVLWRLGYRQRAGKVDQEPRSTRDN